MPVLPLRRFVLGLRARYHGLLGRRAYRAGRLELAGRHLDAARVCGDESFTTLLLLGKIAFSQADVGRAAECFGRARTVDRARFDLEGFPSDFISRLRSRPASAARIHYRVVIESGPGESTRRRTSPRRAGVAGSHRSPLPMGDFSSQSEWLRYRDLPAIRPGEGTDVDWDAEARKLFDD